MIPATIHAPTPIIPKLFELLSDCVSWKAMTLPRMVSAALTRGITRRVFLPTIAERCPSLENHPICDLPKLHAFAFTPASEHATSTAYAQIKGIASLKCSIFHQVFDEALAPSTSTLRDTPIK
jgi:hypothetical protein